MAQLIKQNLQVQFKNGESDKDRHTKIFQHVKDGSKAADLCSFAEAVAGLYEHTTVGDVVVVQYQKVSDDQQVE